MFRLTKPTNNEISQAVARTGSLDSKPDLLHPVRGLLVPKLPPEFSHDLSRTQIGRGLGSYEAAVDAFRQWRQFDLGWVKVANPNASVEDGQIVAVEVYSLGLWSLNISRIVSVTKDTHAFGFIYKTTPDHVEKGEERFLLTFDPNTLDVHYELEAVSKPRYWMVKLGYPVTRSFQHRFARDSHERMRTVVPEKCP